jgi:threonine dehydrogenase-like Zn-dependent dehydrogenase
MKSYYSRAHATYPVLPGFALVPKAGEARMVPMTPELPLPSRQDVPPGHIIVDVVAALLCHSDRTQGLAPGERGGATRGLAGWLPEGGRVILHEAALRLRWGGPEIAELGAGFEPGAMGTTLVRWPEHLGAEPCSCPSCRRGSAKHCYYGFDRIVEFGIKEIAGAGQRRFIMPAAAFVPLRAGMRPHWGALVEPTATFANGLREALAMAHASYGPEWPAELDGRKPAALFFGLGPIALFGCMVARRLGFTPIGVSRTPLERSARARALVRMGGHYFTTAEEPDTGWKDVLPTHRIFVVGEGSGDGESLSLLDYRTRQGGPRWDPLTAFLFQSIPGQAAPLTFDAGTALTMHTLHSNLVRFFVNSDRDDFALAQEAILGTPPDVVEGFFTEMDDSFEALASRFWSVWDRPRPELVRTGVWFREDELPPVD